MYLALCSDLHTHALFTCAPTLTGAPPPPNEGIHRTEENKWSTGKSLPQVLCCQGNPREAIILFVEFYCCFLCYFNEYSLCPLNNTQIARNGPFHKQDHHFNDGSLGNIFPHELCIPTRLAYVGGGWFSVESNKVGGRSIKSPIQLFYHLITWLKILA